MHHQRGQTNDTQTIARICHYLYTFFSPWESEISPFHLPLPGPPPGIIASFVFRRICHPTVRPQTHPVWNPYDIRSILDSMTRPNPKAKRACPESHWNVTTSWNRQEIKNRASVCGSQLWHNPRISHGMKDACSHRMACWHACCVTPALTLNSSIE